MSPLESDMFYIDYHLYTKYMNEEIKDVVTPQMSDICLVHLGLADI